MLSRGSFAGGGVSLPSVRAHASNSSALSLLAVVLLLLPTAGPMLGPMCRPPLAEALAASGKALGSLRAVEVTSADSAFSLASFWGSAGPRDGRSFRPLLPSRRFLSML